MAQTKGNGAGVGEFATGTYHSRFNLKVIMVDTGGDLQSQDDATREAVERALQAIQPLAYYLPSNSSGQIHCIVDASQFDATSLQTRLQAIGTDTVGGYNFASAAVTEGTVMVIS